MDAYGPRKVVGRMTPMIAGFPVILSEQADPKTISLCTKDGEPFVKLEGDVLTVTQRYRVTAALRWDDDVEPIWSKIPQEVLDRDAYRGFMYIGPPS